ncbi:MAG: hypothetical protein GY745_17820 [Actinomycetia bacterium]|nr:hypothetical protein [Actinomycetes bacterium]MCP4086889.1 hypothetical protein [Actinomycetes bacterium]
MRSIRVLALGAMLFFGAGCGSEASFDPGLSGALPMAEEMPVGLLDLSPTAVPVEKAGPDGLGVEDSPSSEWASRAGRVGVRKYAFVDADGFAEATVLLLLQREEDASSALSQWDQHPPERVHESANTYKRSQDWVESNVDDWRFEIVDPAGRINWAGICLDGARDGDPRCVAHHGWATFCEWTLEVVLSRPGWSMEDPEAAAFLSAVGNLTADRLSCEVVS